MNTRGPGRFEPGSSITHNTTVNVMFPPEDTTHALTIMHASSLSVVVPGHSGIASALQPHTERPYEVNRGIHPNAQETITLTEERLSKDSQEWRIGDADHFRFMNWRPEGQSTTSLFVPSLFGHDHFEAIHFFVRNQIAGNLDEGVYRGVGVELQPQPGPTTAQVLHIMHFEPAQNYARKIVRRQILAAIFGLMRVDELQP